jgi:hypothetical protein
MWGPLTVHPGWLIHSLMRHVHLILWLALRLLQYLLQLANGLLLHGLKLL